MFRPCFIFIAGFSQIANPLFLLTLAFPNFSVDFILETDASDAGLGAVLSQKQPSGRVMPIAYASRTL